MSLARLAGLALLPPVTFGAVVAAYEVFVVPGVQNGQAIALGTRIAFGAAVACGLMVTGACAERPLAVLASAAWTTVVWRLMATALYAFHAPGFLKYEPGGLSYWTLQLLVEAVVWLVPVAGGHMALRWVRSREGKRPDSPA